jgi:hypothetical protein
LAVLIGAETSRPVTSSSGTSSQARLLRIRIPHGAFLLLAVRPDGVVAGGTRTPAYYGISVRIGSSFTERT